MWREHVVIGAEQNRESGEVGARLAQVVAVGADESVQRHGKLCAVGACRQIRWTSRRSVTGRGPLVCWALAGGLVPGCDVAVPGAAGVVVLAVGGGVVEAEGLGDDGCGDVEDELAQC